MLYLVTKQVYFFYLATPLSTVINKDNFMQLNIQLSTFVNWATPCERCPLDICEHQKTRLACTSDLRSCGP